MINLIKILKYLTYCCVYFLYKEQFVEYGLLSKVWLQSNMKLLILVAALCAAALAAPDTRIISGINATLGQFPHMVAVRHSGTFICGGAIIGLKWVLTSGECVWEYQGTEHAYSVMVGTLSIIPTPSTIQIGVIRVIPHPNFKTRDTLYYANVGLIELSSTVPIGTTVGLAVLPKSGTVVPTGEVAELSGWGGTNARVSPHLQWASMTVMSIVSCTSAVGGGASFNSGHICSNASPGPSACWYDHGGPLVKRIGLDTVILGVTAYAGCMDPTHPTIYTNIGYDDYSAWITKETGIVPPP